MDELNKQVKRAQDLFVELIPLIKAETGHLDEQQMVAWWAGFASAMAGCAAAEIGHEAVGVIGEATQGAAITCMASDDKRRH